MRIKKAFTLAEIMIVLTIIGVLAAILLPIAFQATPDEDVMKFKKANNTLGNVIRELTNSDKYYADGDLGKKADGTVITTSVTSYNTYFCSTFADMLNTKAVQCNKSTTTSSYVNTNSSKNVTTPNNNISTAKSSLDTTCTGASVVEKMTNFNYVTTSDGITYLEPASQYPFGRVYSSTGPTYYFPDPEDVVGTAGYYAYHDANGMDGTYKVLCVSINGFKDANGAFGYGIRRDGKILPGAKADEWMAKSIQKGE